MPLSLVPWPIAPAHFVASTMRSRLPRAFIHLPTISSVRPTVSSSAAERVDVGRIDEVDAALEGAIQDGERRRFVALQAEGHRAETERRDAEPRAAQLS